MMIAWRFDFGSQMLLSFLNYKKEPDIWDDWKVDDGLQDSLPRPDALNLKKAYFLEND